MAEPPPGPPTLDRLRSAIRSAPSTSGRIEAMEALLERSARPPTRFLANVALDDEVPIDVRLKAVAALGASASRSAVDALVEALGQSSQQVVRRAAERLGTLPGTSQLSALKRVRTGNPQTQAAVQWAKLLVSYRNRLGEYRLGDDAGPVRPDRRESEELRARPLSRTMIAELEPRVSAPIFGLELTTRGGTAFECGERNYVTLLTAETARSGAARLGEAQAIPTVVLQRSLESGEFVVSHVVLTDPEPDGGVRVRVVRRSGSVVMTGRAGFDGDSISFELVSTKTPYLPPTLLSGRLDGNGTLVVDRLVTTQRLTPAQRRMTRAPSRQVRPAPGG